MQESNETKESPSLDVSVNLEGKVLQIEYRVKNSTPKPIYLFNVLWDFDVKGDYISAPQELYLALRKDGTLHLSKQILPLPQLKTVELRIIPFATKIEAGQDFSERIELAVPLTEYNPYYPKEESADEEVKLSESVVFTVQFIRQVDGLKINPATMDNAFSVWHQKLLEKVETLQSKPKPISVQVKKRTDKFERF